MSTLEENQSQEMVRDDNDCVEIVLPNVKMNRFVNLYVTGQYSLSKLATLLDVHRNTLLQWLKRDDVKAVIADLQESTHEVVSGHLKNLTIKAMDKLDKLMDSPVDAVALQAVKDVLDRGGHKTKNEIKVDKTITTFEQKLENIIEKTIDGEVMYVENDE